MSLRFNFAYAAGCAERQNDRADDVQPKSISQHVIRMIHVQCFTTFSAGNCASVQSCVNVTLYSSCFAITGQYGLKLIRIIRLES